MTEEYIIDMMDDIELSPEPPPTQPLIQAGDASAAIEDMPSTKVTFAPANNNDERSISKASMTAFLFCVGLVVYITFFLGLEFVISPSGAVSFTDRGMSYRLLPLVAIAIMFSRPRSRRRVRHTAAAFLHGMCPYQKDTLRRSAKEWLAKESWEVICETARELLCYIVGGLKIFRLLAVVSIAWYAACLAIYFVLQPILRMCGKLMAWEILRLLEMFGYINEWDIQGKFVECFASQKGSGSWCDEYQGAVELASTIALFLVISVIIIIIRMLLTSMDIFGEQAYYASETNDGKANEKESEISVV